MGVCARIRLPLSQAVGLTSSVSLYLSASQSFPDWAPPCSLGYQAQNLGVWSCDVMTYIIVSKAEAEF